MLSTVCVREVRVTSLMISDTIRHRARKMLLLTYNQRLTRMAFARKHMHWNLRQWKNVIWRDESLFTVSDYNNNYVYRRAVLETDALILNHLIPKLSPSWSLPFTMSGTTLVVRCLGTLLGAYQNT